jgi:hypothetical protein
MKSIENVTRWRPKRVCQSLLRLIALLVLFMLVTACSPPGAVFAIDEAGEVKAQLGFRGQAKLGSWIPMLVETPDRLEPKKFQLKLVDGDDTPITYVGNLHSVGTELNQHQGFAKIGRGYGNAQLQLLDIHDNVVCTKNFPLTSAGLIHSSTRRMILVLEPGERLAQTIESNAVFKKGEKSELVVSIDSPNELPLDWFCYQGVDTVFLVTSDMARIKNITDDQWLALEKWIENGGRLIFSAAYEGANLLREGAALKRFCPGRFLDTVEMSDSGRLEGFANNGQLISRGEDPIPISRIEEVDGVVLLQQDDHPLIIRQARGFGEIVFVAFDLDSPRLVQWPGYGNLIQRLQNQVDAQEAAQSQTSESRGSSISHFGYEDLIGQLRVPLDRFSAVRFVAFTWIAVLIGLYILLIGPGDYFFLKNVVGKMELTWITFPLLSLLFCGLAYGISQMTRPSSIQVNQLEIVDIDATTNAVRGTVWSNLYSPAAGSCDISVNRQTTMGFDIESDLLSWQGLPGEGLGGMQTRVSGGISKPGYQLTIESPAESGNYISSLTDVPIYVSATKSLFTQWNAHFPANVKSQLVHSARAARLEGTVTNPLDVPLTNVRLLFENYAYILPKDLEAGETIDVLSEMKERNVRSLLTRRTTTSDQENKGQNRPWNPQDTRVSRIADMLMFFRAAGGSNYTGLTHSFQDFVDLSDHLYLKRAILVGEIKPNFTNLKINDQTVSEEYDRTNTFVRILLPVTYQQRTR